MKKTKIGVLAASGLIVSALVVFGVFGVSQAHEGSEGNGEGRYQHNAEEEHSRWRSEPSERARGPRRGDAQRPPQFDGPPEGRERMSRGAVRGPLGAAADALGVDADELRSGIAEGKTIREFAEERGIDVDNAVDILVERQRERIEEMFNSSPTGPQGPKGGKGPFSKWR